MTLTRPALLLAATGLVLAGCGGNGSTDAGPAVRASAPASAPADAPTDGTGDASGSPAAGALPERPQRDQCVDVPEAEDGLYTVYEAGTAVVTRDGDRLVLGEVAAADGWTAGIDSESADEVEVEFRDGAGTELDLEVEIDDGRVEVEICNDDD